MSVTVDLLYSGVVFFVLDPCQYEILLKPRYAGTMRRLTFEHELELWLIPAFQARKHNVLCLVPWSLNEDGQLRGLKPLSWKMDSASLRRPRQS